MTRPKASILLTCYNRGPAILEATLSALYKNDLSGCEVVLVDDGSTIDYGNLLTRYGRPGIQVIKISTAIDRPGSYSHDGFNDPPYAWNRAIVASKGEYLMFLSSDTILQPDSVARAREYAVQSLAYHSGTLNSGGEQFCSPSRPKPLGWFMGVHRDIVEEIDGHDEEYLRGLAYEDNDFAGRVFQKVDAFVLDFRAYAVHQQHPMIPPAQMQKGLEANRLYTLEKWGGKCPFADDAHEAIPHMRFTVGKKMWLLKK